MVQESARRVFSDWQAGTESESEFAGDTRLSEFIGFNMKRVLAVTQTDLMRVLAEHDLRHVSFSALMLICEYRGINQTQLSDLLRVERSNLVQIIDGLTKAGLVTRNRVTGDRRSYALVASARGRQVAQEVTEAVRDHEQRMYDALDAVERAELQRLLRKLHESF